MAESSLTDNTIDGGGRRITVYLDQSSEQMRRNEVTIMITGIDLARLHTDELLVKVGDDTIISKLVTSAELGALAAMKGRRIGSSPQS